MKNKLKVFALVAMLLTSLLTMTGCGKKEELPIKEKEIVGEEVEKSDEKTKEEEKKQEQAKETDKKTPKPIDKTPIDINDVNSYFFVVNGKKYSSGDKVSLLESSDLRLNKAGSEKELAVNGYLLLGGGVYDSKNKEAFEITPFNNTKSKIKAADAVIGGFKLDKYNYRDFSGDVEIYGGITIGTSIDDIKAVFGEPSKIDGEIGSSNLSYRYDAKESYREFIFIFNEEGKVETIRWQNFVF